MTGNANCGILVEKALLRYAALEIDANLSMVIDSVAGEANSITVASKAVVGTFATS